jgi:hypothetical protein
MKTPFALASLLFLFLLPSFCFSQDGKLLEYNVKFICGSANPGVVAAGDYFTAINVHNPGNVPVSFREKISIALPGEKPGPVSAFSDLRLGPDEALEIDCREILQHAHSTAPFLKGFAIIETRAGAELDVIAVYTASGSTKRIETLQVLNVTPRSFMGCPDLIVEKIDRPEWDEATHQSVIRASIKNIGMMQAGPSLARVIDPTTRQPTGAPYNDIAQTPALAPGASVTVTFHLPYWVYNPDVTLEVTADYKNEIPECNEDNNVKVFQGIG